MKIIKKRIRSSNNTFIITDYVKKLLCVRYESGVYYAYFETDENTPKAKLIIKLLEASKYYSKEELDGFSYTETIEKSFSPVSVLVSNEDQNVHIYHKIIPELTGTETETEKTTTKRITSTKKSPINSNILNTILNN